MAKLFGPLFSLSAKGTIANILTFSKRKIVKQVRFQRKQKDKTTAGRTTQRGYFQEAIEKWHTLTDEQQQQWNDFVYDWAD